MNVVMLCKSKRSFGLWNEKKKKHSHTTNSHICVYIRLCEHTHVLHLQIGKYTLLLTFIKFSSPKENHLLTMCLFKLVHSLSLSMVVFSRVVFFLCLFLLWLGFLFSAATWFLLSPSPSAFVCILIFYLFNFFVSAALFPSEHTFGLGGLVLWPKCVYRNSSLYLTTFGDVYRRCIIISRGRQVVDDDDDDMQTHYIYLFGVRYAKPIRRCTMITGILTHTRALSIVSDLFGFFSFWAEPIAQGESKQLKNSGILWSLVNVFFSPFSSSSSYFRYLLLLPFLRLINFQLLCCVLRLFDAVPVFSPFLDSFFISSLIWISHTTHTHSQTYALW